VRPAELERGTPQEREEQPADWKAPELVWELLPAGRLVLLTVDC